MSEHDALRFVPPFPSDPLAPDSKAKLLYGIRAAMQFADKTQYDFARSFNIPKDQISKLMSGRGYAQERLAPETEKRLLRQMHTWAEEICREKTTQRGTSKLVMLGPTKRLITAAKTCKTLRDLGAAFGPPGIGKTDAARHVADQQNAVYVRLGSDSRKARGLRRAIAGAIRGRGPLVGPVSTATLVDALRVCGRMLIIDQAQDLSDDGLRVVMDVYDECGIAILLIGTVALARRVSVEGDHLFGQLASRIGARVDLLPELSGGGSGDGGGGEALK